MTDWTRGRKTTFEFYRVSWPGFVEVEKLGIFTGGTIEEKALTSLKASATLECARPLDDFADLIRIYLVADDSERLALGTFFSARPKTLRRPALSTGTLDLTSTLTVLADDCFDDVTVIPAGTNIAAWVKGVIDAYGLPTAYTPSDYTNNTNLVYDEYTDSKLNIINDLLGIINYRSLTVDGYGNIIVAPYMSPAGKSPVHVFSKGADSLLLPELDDDMDLSNVPNKLKLTMSNDQETLVAVAVNDNPLSRVSTISRRRVVSAYESLSDIAGGTKEERQQNLDARAREMLISKSSVVQTISFSHGFLPIPCDEVVALALPEMDVENNFSITSRTIPLKPATQVAASVRRFLSL